MDVFGVHQDLIAEYEAFTSSLVAVRGPEIEKHLAEERERKARWPDPKLSLNPTFRSGGTVAELRDEGICTRWAASDALLERWPKASKAYGDNHDDHLRQVERTLRELSEEGATQLVVGRATVRNLEAYATANGDRPTFQAPGRRTPPTWCVRAEPGPGCPRATAPAGVPRGASTRSAVGPGSRVTSRRHQAE